jgi:nicotinate-nucleotide adenylyltransferase
MSDGSDRIGVLGGTFDPIHHGHLALAAEARHHLGLSKVLFVVAAQQPLKVAGHAASAEQRLAMVELACADEPAFVPSDIELRRPPPSYTADTLHELRASLPSRAALWFIMGADSLADLPRWRRSAEIIALARLAAAQRPGIALDPAALDARLPGIAARLDLFEGPRLDIASSDLRARRAAGLPLRYQMPDAVIAYIEAHGLYQD